MNNPNLKARVLVKLPTTPFRDNFRVADHSPRTHLFSLSTPRIWIAGS